MPKIILITHQKGGVGKSTLTYNLAQNINDSAKVAILDYDLQGSLMKISPFVANLDIIHYQDAIENIKNLEYDFIFIDTPPYLSQILPELIQISDLIIVPTKAGVLDLLAIKSTLELIANEKKKEQTIIVFNMVKPNTNLTQDIYDGLIDYEIKVAKTKISDLVVFTRSVLLKGVSTHNKAQKQIDSLTKEVLTALI